MKMRIIIPTRGRTNQQLTTSNLSNEMREHTTIICPKKEVFSLSGLFENIEVVAQPDPNWTIARKRAWILKEWAPSQGYDKVLMLDDDLRFSTRISEGDWHLREIKGKELIPEFERIEEKLGEEFPHVGFGCRQGNNQLEEVGWKIPGKMIYALGYYLPIVLREAQTFILETREDMILSLQLLLKGYPNAIWQTTVVDQRKFDAPGGASKERTIARSDEDAYRMAELFPGYVNVIERAYKASVPRKEVIVQWSKALEDGKAKRKCYLSYQTYIRSFVGYLTYPVVICLSVGFLITIFLLCSMGIVLHS